jgi:hypothetical protein
MVTCHPGLSDPVGKIRADVVEIVVGVERDPGTVFKITQRLL